MRERERDLKIGMEEEREGSKRRKMRTREGGREGCVQRGWVRAKVKRRVYHTEGR